MIWIIIKIRNHELYETCAFAIAQHNLEYILMQNGVQAIGGLRIDHLRIGLLQNHPLTHLGGSFILRII